MLDVLSSSTSGLPSLRMSRKRTRSKSEDISTEAAATNYIRPITMASTVKPAPFSGDPECVKRRSQCDYNIKITYQMAKSGKAPRQIRVYADGAFDLFHQGHARVLMQAKNAFPNVYLIVGVSSDRLIHRFKGRTVMDEDERYAAVTHCRYVDEVLRDAPWEYKDSFLKKHKIDFVAHDDIPYESEDCDDIYGDLKKRGMFLATQRTEGVSTTDIVSRIVRDYDIYVRRNLARGYSAKELNVSFIKEKKLKLQNQMDILKDKGKNLIDSIGERTEDFITKWEDKSRELVDNFMMLFTKNPKNPLISMWNGSKGKIIKALTPPEARPNGRTRRTSERIDGMSPVMKKRRVV